jgi:CCR4-NOT transcription complex subunit 3
VEEEPIHTDTVKKPAVKKPVAPLESAKRPIAPPPKVETKGDDRAVRETKSAVPSVWDFPSMARSTSVPAQEVITAEIAPKPVSSEEPLPVAPVEKPSLIVLLSKTQLEEEASLYDAIQDMDRARPSLIVLNTPFPCHPTFPKRPLFREAKRIEQVDLDTLFFIFYHQPGTYQQYLTAGHLQRQNWLYHRKEQTWFQREDNGRAKTPGKGTYFYFDYTASWSQRLRQDFVFEPQHLETAISE